MPSSKRYGFKAIRNMLVNTTDTIQKFSSGPSLQSWSWLLNIHNNDVPWSNRGQMAVFHCWKSRGQNYHINIKVGGADKKLTGRAFRGNSERVASIMSSSYTVASVLLGSLWPNGPQPTRLLCPWDSPGKNTEWVIMPFREFFPPRDRTSINCVSCISGRFFTTESPGNPKGKQTSS